MARGKTRVGAVSVNLTARTSVFKRRMRGASRTVKTFSVNVGSAVRRIGGMVAGIGALAAGGGFVLLTRNAMQSVDAIGKTADKLGLTTKALAGLQVAAKRSGVPVKTMEMALQRMTRRISEAAHGSGEAKAALEELTRFGLAPATELAKGPADQALRKIAAAMNKVQSSSDRLRLAFKLFDSEGVAIVNMLALGKDGLDKMAKFADKAGLALGRLDVKQVEMANDAIQDMKDLVSGLFVQISAQLAPFVKFVADEFTAWGTSGQGAAKLVHAGFKQVVNVIGVLGDLLGVVNRQWLKLKVGALTTAHAIDVAWNSVQVGIDSAIKRTASGLQSLLERGARAREAFGLSDEGADSTRSRLIGWLQSQKAVSILSSALAQQRLEDSRRLIRTALKDLKNFDASFAQGTFSERIENWFDTIIKKSREAARNALDVMKGTGDATANALNKIKAAAETPLAPLALRGSRTAQLLEFRARQAGARENAFVQQTAKNTTVIARLSREMNDNLDTISAGLGLGPTGLMEIY